MKPRKAILTAAAVTALFSAGGCVYNDVLCVYGPPPETTTYSPYVAQFETGETSDTGEQGSFRPEDNMMQAMYGVPDDREPVPFDPYENMAQPEYGCPVIETYETSETAETAETAETSETAETQQPALLPEQSETTAPDDFDPTINMEPAVYGPPPVEEPPAEFLPEENVNPDVYGPPEWFE